MGRVIVNGDFSRLRFEVENDFILREYSEREQKVGQGY